MIRIIFLIFFSFNTFAHRITVDIDKVKYVKTTSLKSLTIENKLSSSVIFQVFKNNSLFETLKVNEGKEKKVFIVNNKKDVIKVIGIRPPTRSIELE